VVKYCVFQWEEIILSAFGRSRLEAFVQTMLRDGRVTRNASNTRRWAGAAIVRKLATTLFNDAWLQGTISRDVTIYKTFSIILVAALGCRPGDVAACRLDDHKLNYITFQDFKIFMPRDGTFFHDLRASITIPNAKGHKFDDSRNHTMALIPSSIEDAVVCPITLLLTYARRIGQLSFATLDEFIQTLIRRPSGQVIWNDPLKPLLCQFGPAGASLKFDLPAFSEQLGDILATVSHRDGLLERIVSYDLRRGAAADMSHNSRIAHGLGVPTAAVSAAVGHSIPDVEVTARYAGDSNMDMWKPRVEDPYENTINPLSTAVTPY
jgi:integrase